MYQPMLFVHWKQARLLLIPFVVAAFGLPLTLVQGLGAAAGEPASLDAYGIINSYQVWLPFFPFLAVGVGAVLALTAWNWDHQQNHVYALSLPLARWQYVMLKMGAGAALILLPAGALWLGAHVAAASITLPEGLRAYPNQLAFRFFLAVLLAYALFFAMASGTIKTTVWVLTGALAVVVLGEVFAVAMGTTFAAWGEVSVSTEIAKWFVSAGGPFEVFTGNWTLIDV
jgi:hypothetical protein